MKKVISTLALLVSICLGAVAQGLKESGTSTLSLIPEGWSYEIVNGDLNKDGRLDLVILTYPNFREHMKVREDGYEYNFNQPILGVYFGQSDGSYQLWKSYDNVVPARPNEFISIDAFLLITPRGTLQITLSQESSAGSWYNTSTKYTYRYQNGDFYLIGKDEDSYARNTGVHETVSENYLTHKRQRITDNVFDEKVKRKEEWSKLKKEPLLRLGEESSSI